MYIKWFNEFNQFIKFNYLMNLLSESQIWNTTHLESGMHQQAKIVPRGLMQNRKNTELGILFYLESQKSFLSSAFPKMQGDVSAFEEVKT